MISQKKTVEEMRRVNVRAMCSRMKSSGSLRSLIFALMLAVVVQGLAWRGNASAQIQLPGGSSLPHAGYYQSFAEFYQADYKRALRDFESASNRVYKVGNLRFLDSACHWVMIGECYYHIGDYERAMTAYNQSLALYLDLHGASWQSRLEAPSAGPQVDTSAWQRSRISWGTPTRTFKVLRNAGAFTYEFGERAAVAKANLLGGQIHQAEKKPVDATEFMRCIALAMHRRRSIMGATCKYDTLTSRLAGLPNGSGTQIGAFNGVLRGIALASMEDWNAANSTLTNALQLTGGIDHPLTPVALTELALIQMQTGNEAAALKVALEASYSAALFEQFDLVEESLSIATTAHLSQSKTPFLPLRNAIDWAVRERANLTSASLMVRLAECYSESGDFKSSADILSQTKRPMSRNSLNNSVVNSRRNYVAAVNYFLQGDSAKGQEALAAALTAFNKAGSKWLYQLRTANTYAVAGDSPRKADQLYSALLRDPTDIEWQRDPFEAMAFLKSDHLVAIEHWFEIVVGRRDYDRALQISELLRRHRFFSSLPLGGRLMAFRWVMHAPEQALSSEALDQRKQFLLQNPNYKTSQDEAKRIRLELLALPVKPANDSDELRKQRKLFISMFNLSKTQEAALASFALRRTLAEQAFPPKRDMAKFRSSMPDKQVAFVTVAARGGYHVFKLDSKDNTYVKKHDGRVINKAVSKLMIELGVPGASVDLEDLKKEEDWKKVVRELGKTLLGGGSPDDWNGVQQLVVIPDGTLWYVPFEILEIGEAGSEKSLRDLADVRYSPTLFLAFNEQRKYRPLRRTAVVSAKMHPKAEIEVTQKAFEKLKEDLPDAVKLEEKISITTNYLGSVLDQLVVWSDIRTNKNGVYGMSPAQLDKGAGSNLASWMGLPWWGPEHVVMPGFTSGAGKSKADGSEMFLASCGLMASGTRSILLSRWRVGGENSLELTREFAKRQPRERGIVALREAVDASRKLELDFEKEPRLKFGTGDAPIKAEHPFFWAGHMLLEIPRTAREADAAPADAGAAMEAKDGDAKPDEAKPDGAKPDEVNPLNPDDPVLPGEAPKGDPKGEAAKGEGGG